MPPRRSHPKSRRGCLNCKKARVKCDESGPPCGRCGFRGTDCEYHDADKRVTITPTITPSEQPAESDSPGRDVKLRPNRPTGFPANDRMLELKLVHHYTVQTYKSLTTESIDDSEEWQRTVPELAFKHEFLLNAICALSAFEIASYTDNDKQRYVAAGLEYQGRALSLSHELLSNLTSEVALVMFLFSSILMTLALASSRFAPYQASDSMVQNTLTHVELLRGVVATMKNCPGDPYLENVIERLKPLFDLPKKPLNAATRNLLHRLRKANEQRKYADKDDDNTDIAAHIEGCGKAIFHLEECLERYDGDLSTGYFIGWPEMSGDEYLKAVRSKDRLALLIMTTWAAAVNRLGRKVWWVKDFGSSLVDEIAETMADDTDDLVSEVFDWARQELKRID